MQKVIINIGDKIEMTHVKSASRRKLSGNTYGSMLLDYDGMRSAKISMPIFEGKVVPLELEDEYDLCFFTSLGLYRCRAKVVKRYREGKMYVLNMEFLSLPKKFQRRQFYRLECMQEIHFRVISEEEKTLRDVITESSFSDDTMQKAYEHKLKEFATQWENALMTDISGGGVRLQCRHHLEPGTYIEVKAPLVINEEIFPFQCMAKIVADVNLEGNPNENELRCEFDNIRKEQRELVVKYVFEEQKRRLRK